MLQGERVLLRPGRPEDLDRLVQIRSEPEVARWWGTFDIEEIKEEFIGADTGFVIEAGGIRAYERVGFRRVGVMRQYERAPDGTWHDGLLMEMLKEDFRR